MPASATQAPLLDAWLRCHDRRMAEAALEAFEENDALADGARAVAGSQLNAILNTAAMCPSVKEFRAFVRSRAERRKKAGQETKADFWEAILSQIQEVTDRFAAPALEACDLGRTDEAEMRVVRAYLEHLVAHCQYLSSQSK